MKWKHLGVMLPLILLAMVACYFAPCADARDFIVIDQGAVGFAQNATPVQMTRYETTYSTPVMQAKRVKVKHHKQKAITSMPVSSNMMSAVGNRNSGATSVAALMPCKCGCGCVNCTCNKSPMPYSAVDVKDAESIKRELSSRYGIQPSEYASLQELQQLLNAARVKAAGGSLAPY